MQFPLYFSFYNVCISLSAVFLVVAIYYVKALEEALNDLAFETAKLMRQKRDLEGVIEDLRELDERLIKLERHRALPRKIEEGQ